MVNLKVGDNTADGQQSFLQSIARNLPGVVFRYKLHRSGKDEILYLSEGALRLWGIDPQDVMDDTSRVWSKFNPDDLSKLRLSIQQSVKHLQKWEAEWRYDHPDGTIKWQRGAGNPVRAEDGSTHWDAMILDITDEKLAQYAVTECENRIGQLFDGARNIAIQGCRPDGTVRYWNSASEKLYGYTREEAIGKKITDLIVPESGRDRISALLNDLMHGNNYPAGEMEMQRKNGLQIPVFTNYTVIELPGKESEIFGIHIDISSQKSTKGLLGEISLQFNEQEHLHVALEEVLKLLVQYGDFSLAEAWLISKDKKRLNLIGTYPNDEAAEQFYQDTSVYRSFAEGEGLPGVVWKDKKATLWEDLSGNKAFIRSNAAIKFGLKAALGIPLKHHEEVLGVLVFGTKRAAHLSYYETFFKSLQLTLGLEVKRKKLEEELHELFDNAPDIQCIVGTDGKYLKVNPAFCKLTGYTAEELTSHPFTHFVHPEDLAKSEKEFSETITRERRANNFVNRYITKSGEHKWISWSSSDLPAEDGLSFAYGRDITEERKLQDLLDSATRMARIGAWEVDVKTGEIYMSPITREIHELPDGFEPILEDGINFYREDVRENVRSVIDEAISKHASWDFELPIITAKGNERWIRSIGKPEFREGECVRLLGSFQDIHDRKVAELRLQNTADNIPGLIIQHELNPDGVNSIPFLTKGAEDIWGCTAEACQADFSIIRDQLVLGGDIEILRSAIMRSVERMEPWHCTFRSRKPDGTMLWLEGFGKPKQLQNGSIQWDSFVINITEKEKLKELLNTVVKMARIGSWELDLRERTNDKMYWSDMTRKILGVGDDYDPSLTGGFEFYVEESKMRIQHAVNELIEKGTEFDVELLLIRADDRLQWVRCIGQSERVEDTCIRIYGSFQDVHQHKMIQLELEHAFEKRNTILESIGDAFFSVDKNWVVTYWNKQAEVLLNQKREDILGKDLWEIFVEAKSLEFYTQYKAAMDTGTTRSFEAYYPRLEQWYDVSAYPSEEGLSVYFRDISNRKLAEEQIRASSERFEKVAQATNDAIWDWDIVKGSLYRGSGFKDIFGYEVSRKLAREHFWSDSFHPDDKARISESINTMVEDKLATNWMQEYRIIRRNGDIASVIDRGIVIRDEQGNAVRMVGAITDITQQKKYEASLKDLNDILSGRARELAISNAELEQFAYVASHDLQEPLRMVTSFLTQLDKKYGELLDERAKQYIYYAVDGAQRMRQIILDLLEYSRVGRNEEEKELVDTSKVVEEICMLYRKTIDDTQAQITADNLPVIYSHRAPMLQVFQNLIGNALKYSKPDIYPEVTITCNETYSDWTFQVADNGIGMDVEYHEKIFEIFQRLHAKDEYGGTGMGLAIVKKIIEGMDGHLWVESATGQGSTFYFSIPKSLQ